MKFIFTLRTSDDKLTRLLVVDRLRPFINADDADDVWERLGLSCCWGADFSVCWLFIENNSSSKRTKKIFLKLNWNIFYFS